MREDAFLDIDRLEFRPTSVRTGWIVSYADMMTIILTFFILLLSISTIAQTKYEMLVQAFTGERAGNLMEVQDEIDRIIEEQSLGGEIATTLDKDGLKIEFSNALLFDSGEAEMTERGLEVFEPIRQHLIADLKPQYGLVIEGYTDDVPIKNARYASNWELSTSRAIGVMERLVVGGMDRRRISVQGFANTRTATEVDIADPLALSELDDPTREEVRASNRRVIIRIDSLDPAVVGRIIEARRAQKTAPDATKKEAGEDASAPVDKEGQE